MANKIGRSSTGRSSTHSTSMPDGPTLQSSFKEKQKSQTGTFLSLFKGKERLEYEHMAASMSRSTRVEISASLTEWSGSRAFCYTVLESVFYSIAIGCVIVMNAILIILETDQKAHNEDISEWLRVMPHIFLGIYVVEIVVRFYVFRLAFFSSGWNNLDLTVVITDTCLEIAKIWVDKEALSEIPSVAILRIFRLARLVRLIAMLSIFEELHTMLLGFGSAMRAIFWAAFMIGVVLTVCSIVAVEIVHPLNVEVAATGVYGSCDRCGRAFESVMESNLTFIQQIIAGDGWALINIPIIEAYPLSGAFFLFVYGLVELGLLNLILTVIVNAAESARMENHEMLLREKVAQTERMKRDLVDLCSELDRNKDERITMQEFLSGVDANADFQRILALLDIQRQDCETIYHLMDEDLSGDVDYNEFMNAIIATKFESVDTKILFLKANIHDVLAKLRDQERILKNDLVKKMKASPDVTEAVNNAVKSSFAELEFQGLSEKLDAHWQHLQAQQAQSCQMMEKVLTELSREPSLHRALPIATSLEVRPIREGNAPKSAMSSIPVLRSCDRCEVADKDAPVCATYYSPNNNERGGGSSTKPSSPR